MPNHIGSPEAGRWWGMAQGIRLCQHGIERRTPFQPARRCRSASGRLRFWVGAGGDGRSIKAWRRPTMGTMAVARHETGQIPEHGTLADADDIEPVGQGLPGAAALTATAAWRNRRRAEDGDEGMSPAPREKRLRLPAGNRRSRQGIPMMAAGARQPSAEFEQAEETRVGALPDDDDAPPGGHARARQVSGGAVVPRRLARSGTRIVERRGADWGGGG